MSELFRILHVLPDLAIGGGQQVVLRNIVAMREAGRATPGSPGARFEHIVCSVKPPADMAPKFAAAAIEVVELGVSGPARIPRALHRLSRLVRDRSISLIHTNNTGPDRFFGQLAALRRGVPVVNWLHAEPPGSCTDDRELVRRQSGKERLKIAGRDWLTRRTTRRFVAVSNNMREQWMPYLWWLGVPESGVVVVHSGIAPEVPSDLGPPPSEVRRAIAGPDASPVLMYVARIVPGKGHDHLVPLMAGVGAAYSRAKLVLVGDGELRAETEQRARDAGVADRFVFLGHRDDVPRLLRACDLFVFPSLSEGFPLVVLEAMGAGKPLVSFDLPALHESVEPEGTGILVPLGDTAALTAAALRLLADPARMAAMGERGRLIVAKRFSLRASVEALARVYLSVLEPAGT